MALPIRSMSSKSDKVAARQFADVLSELICVISCPKEATSPRAAPLLPFHPAPPWYCNVTSRARLDPASMMRSPQAASGPGSVPSLAKRRHRYRRRSTWWRRGSACRSCRNRSRGSTSKASPTYALKVWRPARRSALLHVQGPFAREALVCCSFQIATVVVLFAAKYKVMESETASILLL